MGHIYRVECQDCQKFMQYDREYFEKWDLMRWTCWTCGYQCVTTNLHDTCLRQGSEEE